MSRSSASEVAEFRCPDGASLRYSTAGDGPPVVLIHGFGLDAAMWEPQWPALRKHHRAIRYDLRGYGGSTLPEGAYSHVDDLLALLAFLRAQPAHLVGLSMGGRVALQLALQEPAAVRSLTLVDSVLDGYRMSDAWSQSWRRIVATAKGGDLPGAKQLWRRHEVFAPARARAEVAAPLEAMLARYSGWHWLQTDQDRVPARPAIELLPTLTIPALIVVGALDLPDFQAIARRLAAEMPQATLRVIAGAGHMANMEAPDQFGALLLEHLAKA